MAKKRFIKELSVAVILAIFVAGAAFNLPIQKVESVSPYIVQGDSLAEVKAAIVAVGGEITHELGIISAVGAELSARQRAQIAASFEDLRIFEDRQLKTASRRDQSYTKEQKEAMIATFEAEMEATEEALKTARKALRKDKDNATLQAEVDYLEAKLEHFKKMLYAIDKNLPQATAAQHVRATELHAQGITGAGVTVAILDTGIWHDQQKNKDGRLGTVIGAYDAQTGNHSTRKTKVSFKKIEDKHGHGTHVSSIISGSDIGPQGDFNGVAPGVDLVIVKSFDDAGLSSYLEVIRGIDWVVAHKDTYNIRILNLSFSTTPNSHYWDDPLNQAVMAAWGAGIVVVTSAGNQGPDAMTIDVPGNVPYVITVGAISDSHTPDDPSDDVLTSFSAAGPTVEGFVKPEIIAPGGHLSGLMDKHSTVAKAHPEFHDGEKYFTMSGTSQATAVVSGVIALMLESKPG